MQPFSDVHGSLQREQCSVPAVSGWLLSSSFHGTKGVSFDNFIPNCPFCPITKIMREPSRGEFLHCLKNSCCRKVIQQELGSHIFYLKENSSRRGMKGFHTRLILKLSFKTVAHLSHTSDPSAFCFPTVFRLMRNLTGYPPRLFIIFGIMHVLVGHVFRGQFHEKSGDFSGLNRNTFSVSIFSLLLVVPTTLQVRTTADVAL